MNGGAASLAELGAEQFRLVGRSREFLRQQQARGVDTALHPECYLSGWSNVRGNARLLKLARQSGARLKLGIRRLKDAANVMRYAGLETQGAEQSCEGFDALVVTWCRAADFSADGEFRDRYFRTSSRSTPKSLWLAIATDQEPIARRDANVRVFRKRTGSAGFSPAMLGRELLRGLGAERRANGRLPLLSGVVTHAERVVAAVSAILRSGKFREIALPYEAQPFQHAVYRAAKRIDPQMRTIGYLHSALPPVPSDLAFREGAPDLLLVHGAGQLEILVRDLGWPRERLRTIPALRYRVEDHASLGGFIFLPMSFADAQTIVTEFRDFVAASPRASLAPLVVRNHPVMRESPRHLKLEAELNAVLEAHADRFSEAADIEPLSVFIGATAAIVEALERGVGVIHICSQPLTEAHTADLWRGFLVERPGKCLFRYRIRERGSYISFGSGDDLFDRYIREGGSR